MVKAQTRLPFAKEAAELLWGAPAVAAAAQEATANPAAAGRRIHFELRARSIDAALKHLGLTRIIEIAAGLSFRGLAMAGQAGVFYLDTDLPEMAAIKSELVTRLHPAALAGILRVRALDALDPGAFREAVGELPPGPIAIVQEGLLMYLDQAEKARLAMNVRESLSERGGAWVTADIYVRSRAPVYREERTQKFLEAHRVEEKKFADWRAAEAFFAAQGLAITQRLSDEGDPWPVRQTWVVRP